MARSAVKQLLDLMGAELGPPLAGSEAGLDLIAAHAERGSELADLLLDRNGCYSSTRALLIRPLQSDAAPKGIVEWNAEGGWRSHFKADLAGALFFAEDLFGEQFAVRQNAVWRFEPESADWSFCAPTLGAWAESLLDEEGQPELEAPLAKQWQAQHGKIPSGKRLRPPIPFIFKESANASLDDFRPIPEDEVMGFLATIANALRDVPAGGQIQLRTVNQPAESTPDPDGRAKRRWWWPFGPRT